MPQQPQATFRWLPPAWAGALALMGSCTLRQPWGNGDGPDLNYFGAPLAWHRFSMVGSLEHTIDPSAFAIDVLVHIAMATALLGLFRNRLPELSWRRSALLTTPVLFASFLGLAPLFVHPHFNDFKPPGFEPTSSPDLHLGWDFPYHPDPSRPTPTSRRPPGTP